MGERVREADRDSKERAEKRERIKEILIERRNIRVKKRKSGKYIYKFRKKDQIKTVKKSKEEHLKVYFSYLLIIPDKV